jgi:hypothetical protein
MPRVLLSGLALEQRAEALCQIVDGRVRGATVTQQLEALDLIGQLAGLDEPADWI